jgi:monoamine oxidase
MKNETSKTGLNRRDFVRLLGLAGGTGAAYLAMRELGLLAADQASKPVLAGQGTGQRVLILGAGLAGLTAAYELEQAGYECEILEALQRPGGRCWTVRAGSELKELDGRVKVASFDKNHYFNPGPARIPQHHSSTLNYCRQFGLELELFANQNAAAWLYVEDSGPTSGTRIRRREATTDMAGYSSELLAKAVDQGALNEELSALDSERLLDFLSDFGALNSSGQYAGDGRRGFSEWPGAYGQSGLVDAPHPLEDLLAADFWSLMTPDQDIHQQMSMFQIRGGTDGLAQAFAEEINSKINYGTQVIELRNVEGGVEVDYQQNGDRQQASADYCVCTLPLSVLSRLESNLSPAKQRAIGQVHYLDSGKIGLQFGRRFWEEDDGIFGGISRTNMPIGQIWYPSNGYLGRKGILVGYYNFGPEAAAIGHMDDADRLELALAQGEKLHPQYREALESSFSVAWGQMPFSRGAFAYYTDSERDQVYGQLLEPEGAIFLAGEHLSYLNGWMAGAIESAWVAIERLHEQALASAA